MYNGLIRHSKAAADTQVTRRKLLLTSALVTSALALPALKITGIARAETTFSDQQKVLLLRIAKDIYPHEGFLDDAPYQAVIDAILKESSSDPKVATLLATGLDDLNKRSEATYQRPYIDIASPDEREALLRTIELTDFFQKIRGGLLFGLYDNKALWPKFGYDGSSWETGGFIEKDFDKLDWLKS